MKVLLHLFFISDIGVLTTKWGTMTWQGFIFNPLHFENSHTSRYHKRDLVQDEELLAYICFHY